MKEETHRHTDGHVKREAEMEVMLSKAKECLETQEAGAESWNGFSSAPDVTSPFSTLTSDFWPPELWEWLV